MPAGAWGDELRRRAHLFRTTSVRWLSSSRTCDCSGCWSLTMSRCRAEPTRASSTGATPEGRVGRGAMSTRGKSLDRRTSLPRECPLEQTGLIIHRLVANAKQEVVSRRASGVAVPCLRPTHQERPMVGVHNSARIKATLASGLECDRVPLHSQPAHTDRL